MAFVLGPLLFCWIADRIYARQYERWRVNHAVNNGLETNRLVLAGLQFTGSEAPRHGDAVFVAREQVGVVKSGCVSPQLGHAIAMARVAVENADIGNKLEVGKLDGHMKRLPANVVAVPFLDPKREKARA